MLSSVDEQAFVAIRRCLYQLEPFKVCINESSRFAEIPLGNGSYIPSWK